MSSSSIQGSRGRSGSQSRDQGSSVARSGSSGKSPSSSRARSGSASGRNPFGPSLGFDPARDPNKKDDDRPLRVELPADAYLRGDTDGTPFTSRPGFNSTAQDTVVQVNQFRVTDLASNDVYQYDVKVVPLPKSPAVVFKCWNTAEVQNWIHHSSHPWVYDGKALAWSTNNIPTKRFNLDLGKLKGKPGNSADTFALVIEKTATIRVAVIAAYLRGQMAWDDSILMAMNFLDHALRAGPSEKMKSMRRNFFHESAKSMVLSPSCVEAVKGIYASIRLTQSIQSGGLGLGVNVDVANCAFFIGQDFEQLARAFISNWDRKWANIQYQQFAELLRPVREKDRNGNEQWVMSEAFKVLRKLAKIRFTIKHRGKTNDRKVYTVKSFSFDPKYGADGANAKTVRFDVREADGTIHPISVYDYFFQRYNGRLRYWFLPLIDTGKSGFYPMEVCSVERFNRYPFKLNPNETSNMIKFAVQRPNARLAEIRENVTRLDWANDKYLRAFGIKINTNLPQVPAKVIKNPEIQFGNQKINPGTSGRWDLRGKKFMQPNQKPLRSWAFAVIDSCVDKAAVDNFVRQFTTTYQGHGGRIEKPPQLFNFPPGRQHASSVEEAYQRTGKAAQQTPQIIFFILGEKVSWVYERMKKNCDCRWALISQMMQGDHVRKAQGQYISNICLKVNAKLGGQTSRIPGVGNNSAFFKAPTMICGLDVSHASPGTDAPSVAAMTASMDKDAAYYQAHVDSNGIRTEIVQPRILLAAFNKFLPTWNKRNGCWPQNLIYLRDGVGEGQFAQVIMHELEYIKKAFTDLVGVRPPKITVIVATKRHHIRFFPQKGDKNGNPLPGTLVEREVTHPFHFDFYLCSHVAIQGTARPVHYQVIYDEIGWKPDDLQKMLYQQCYQYQRATTPVSLHPAIYYAHLAGARARCHEDIAVSDVVPRPELHKVIPLGAMAKFNEPDFHGMTADQKRAQQTETLRLLPLGGADARQDAKEDIEKSMWFI